MNDTSKRKPRPSATSAAVEAVEGSDPVSVPTKAPAFDLFFDDDLPPPVRPERATKRSVYRLEDMQVGRYFLFPESHEKPVRRAAQQAQKKFSTQDHDNLREYNGKKIPTRVHTRKYEVARLSAEAVAKLPEAKLQRLFPDATSLGDAQARVVFGCWRTK